MPLICDALPELIYGADYNPEQWPESVWDEDIARMQESGVNLVSLAIFSWAKLNPAPDVFEFDWLDRAVEKLHAGGIKINMATATASPPAWLGRLYPEIRPIDVDGEPYSHGARQAFTPNSSVFVEHAVKLVSAMAERYADHPAVVMWHINNEYYGNGPISFGEVDARAFREWLKEKYSSLANLNAAWKTAFWSQWYYDWEEVVPPRKVSASANPTMKLDYYRFFSNAYARLYRAEAEAVRIHAPDTPLATNFCEYHFSLNQHEMSEVSDFGAMDIYPDPDPVEDVIPSFSADIARSLIPEKPWILMEQVTSQIQWKPVNPLKRPGVMRLWSMTHVARGSDGAMFFQWRQSRGGSEKFHGAMLPIVGTEESRVWREVCELGADLKKLKPVAGSLPVANVGILHSWDCLWSLQEGGKPKQFEYFEEHATINRACWELGLMPNYIHPDSDDVSRYPFLIVPFFYMLTEEQAGRIRRYVEAGGQVLMTYFTGLVDANDHFHLEGGFPAMLQDVVGFRVEEWDVLPEGRCNQLVFEDGTELPCDQIFEIGQSRGAETVASYKDDFYAGSPALTRNSFGEGSAYYLATRPATTAAWKEILQRTAPDGLLERLVDAPERVEVVLRRNDATKKSYLFLQNYTGADAKVGLKQLTGTDLLSGRAVSGKLLIAATDCAVLELD